MSKVGRVNVTLSCEDIDGCMDSRLREVFSSLYSI